MFGNLMDKLESAQTDIKERLDRILVDGQAEGGLVKVVSTGNKEIKQVWIDESLINEGDKEAIEELTMVAINRALEKAEKVNSDEMQSAAKNIMPNMPGLF